MNLPRLSFIHIASFIAILSLNSCISTDIVEPEVCPVQTPVFLNLAAPEEAPTRAGGSYKLRYVAKLYSGTDRQTNTVTVQRQELIDGDKGIGGIENQMIFYVPQGSPYVIYVFADYIPESYKPNPTTGYYEDYFYDTAYQNQSNVIKMLPTPGKKNTNDVSTDFFNNDRYDCFGGVAALEENKTAEKVEFNLTLHRLVSKVRLVDNSQLSGSFDLTISNFRFLSQYTLKKFLSDETGWAPTNYNKSINLLTEGKFTGEKEQEIFFFYTFASIGTVSSAETPNIQFKLTNHIDPTLVNVISTGNIPVKRNQITTVKGKLLPGINADDPGETPGIEEDGPIILNLSSSTEEWTREESTWQSN